MGQDPERKIKDKGDNGEGDAGGDHPGGATMATSKFQPLGRGGQGKRRVPKEFLSPFRPWKLQGPPALIPPPPQLGGLFLSQTLLVCSVPCRRDVSSPIQEEGRKGAPQRPPPSHLPPNLMTPRTSCRPLCPCSSGWMVWGWLPSRLRRGSPKRALQSPGGAQSQVLDCQLVQGGWRACGEGLTRAASLFPVPYPWVPKLGDTRSHHDRDPFALA